MSCNCSCFACSGVSGPNRFHEEPFGPTQNRVVPLVASRSNATAIENIEFEFYAVGTLLLWLLAATGLGRGSRASNYDQDLRTADMDNLRD